MLVIFMNVAVIFALVAVGFYANRRGILPGTVTPYLTKLLLRITLPAFILISVVENVLTPELLGEITELTVIMVVCYIVGVPLTLLIVKLFRFPKENRGLYAAMILFTNSGFMGLPISFAVFGQHGLLIMVFANTLMMFFMYSIGVIMIGIGGKDKISWKHAAKSAMNHPVVASLVGIVLLFLGVTIPTVLSDFLHLIGEMTVPLSMILVGIQLGTANLSQLLRKPDLIGFTVIKSTFLPALTLAAMYFLDVAPMVKVIIVLCFAMPAAAILVALAERHESDAQLAAGGVSLSTLFSMGTIPVICILLRAMFL